MEIKTQTKHLERRDLPEEEESFCYSVLGPRGGGLKFFISEAEGGIFWSHQQKNRTKGGVEERWEGSLC